MANHLDYMACIHNIDNSSPFKMATRSFAKKDHSEDIYFDSLPYIETLHEDYKDYALALIEEEMQQFRPQKVARVPPIVFRSPFMKHEVESLSDGKEYKPRVAIAFGAEKDVSLSETKIQFEAERIRSLILEAEKAEAADVWRGYNNTIQLLNNRWSNSLKVNAEIVEEINYQRQQAQQNQLGPILERLNLEYHQAVYRKNQQEHAIEALRRKFCSDNIVE